MKEELSDCPRLTTPGISDKDPAEFRWNTPRATAALSILTLKRSTALCNCCLDGLLERPELKICLIFEFELCLLSELLAGLIEPRLHRRFMIARPLLNGKKGDPFGFHCKQRMRE